MAFTYITFSLILLACRSDFLPYPTRQPVEANGRRLGVGDTGPEWLRCLNEKDVSAIECEDECMYYKDNSWRDVSSNENGPWATETPNLCADYKICEETSENFSWGENILCLAQGKTTHHVICIECINGYSATMGDPGEECSGQQAVTTCTEISATLPPTPSTTAPTAAPTMAPSPSPTMVRYTFAPTVEGASCEVRGCWTGEEDCCNDLMANLFMTSKITKRLLFLDSAGTSAGALTGKSAEKETFGYHFGLRTFFETDPNVTPEEGRGPHLESSEDGGWGLDFSSDGSRLYVSKVMASFDVLGDGTVTESRDGQIISLDADTTEYMGVILGQQILDTKLGTTYDPNNPFTPGTIQSSKSSFYTKKTMLFVLDKQNNKIYLVKMNQNEEDETKSVDTVTVIFHKIDCEIADFNIFTPNIQDHEEDHPKTNRMLVLCKSGSVFLTEKISNDSTESTPGTPTDIFTTVSCVSGGTCEARSITFDYEATNFFVAVGYTDPTLYNQRHVYGYTVDGATPLKDLEGDEGTLRLEKVGGEDANYARRNGVDLERIRVAPNNKLYASDRSYGLPLVLDPNTFMLIGQIGKSFGDGADGQEIAFGRAAFGKWCDMRIFNETGEISFPPSVGDNETAPIFMGKDYKFQVQLRNSNREPVQANGTSVKFEVWREEAGGAQGSFTVTDNDLSLSIAAEDKQKSIWEGMKTFKYPTKASYRFKFVARQKHMDTILDETPWFKIGPGEANAAHTRTTSSLLKLEVGGKATNNTISINAFDAFENRITHVNSKQEVLEEFAKKFNLEVEGDEGHKIDKTKFKFEEKTDTFDVKISTNTSGTYQLTITYNGTHIQGSPMLLTAKEGPIGIKTDLVFEDKDGIISKCNKTKKGLVVRTEDQGEGPPSPLPKDLPCSGNWLPKYYPLETEELEDGERYECKKNTLIMTPRDDYGNRINLEAYFREFFDKESGSRSLTEYLQGPFDLNNVTNAFNLPAILNFKPILWYNQKKDKYVKADKVKFTSKHVGDLISENCEKEMDLDAKCNIIMYSVEVMPQDNKIKIEFTVPYACAETKPLKPHQNSWRRTAEDPDDDKYWPDTIPAAPSLEITVAMNRTEREYFPIKIFLDPGVTKVRMTIKQKEFWIAMFFPTFSIVICFALTLFTYVNRDHTIIKYAQRRILYLILFASVLVSVAVILRILIDDPYEIIKIKTKSSGDPINLPEGACFWALWTGVAGSFLMMNSIIMKSYRIHRLAFNKEMKKRKITDKFILTVIFGVEFAWVIIGTAWLLSNHDEKDMKTKHILDKRLSDYEVGRVAQKQLGTDIFIEHHACDLSSGTSNYFMWVTVGLMSGGYVIVIFFSFLNKSIPTAFNETNHIRQGVVSSLSLIVIYLGTGVTEIPTFNPGLYLILFSMCINTAQFLVILNIFAPKLIKILRGHNADLNDLSHAVDHVRTYSSSDMSSRKRTTSRLSGKSNGIRTGRFTASSEEMFKSSFKKNPLSPTGSPQGSPKAPKRNSGTFSGKLTGRGGTIKGTLKKKVKKDVEMTKVQRDTDLNFQDIGMGRGEDDGTFVVTSPLAKGRGGSR